MIGTILRQFDIGGPGEAIVYPYLMAILSKLQTVQQNMPHIFWVDERPALRFIAAKRSDTVFLNGTGRVICNIRHVPPGISATTGPPDFMNLGLWGLTYANPAPNPFSHTLYDSMNQYQINFKSCILIPPTPCTGFWYILKPGVQAEFTVYRALPPQPVTNADTVNINISAGNVWYDAAYGPEVV